MVSYTKQKSKGENKMDYKKLPKASGVSGSSMGRVDDIEEDRQQNIKFHLYKMVMSPCGCYDAGGAYWGSGDFKTGYMYHAHGIGKEQHNNIFLRAKNREDAKKQVVKLFPNATFYR